MSLLQPKAQTCRQDFGDSVAGSGQTKVWAECKYSEGGFVLRMKQLLSAARPHSRVVALLA